MLFVFGFFIFMDEVLEGSLDTSGKEAIIDLLHNKANISENPPKSLALSL